ncbi:uncharacterized protein ACBT44_013524 [Syngnathus typhle]
MAIHVLGGTCVQRQPPSPMVDKVLCMAITEANTNLDTWPMMHIKISWNSRSGGPTTFYFVSGLSTSGKENWMPTWSPTFTQWCPVLYELGPNCDFNLWGDCNFDDFSSRLPQPESKSLWISPATIHI